MNLRVLLLAPAALAVACSSRPAGTAASFSAPTAAAVFSGWTHTHPRSQWKYPRPYLAVANGRTDELRVVDPETDTTLVSPGAAFPLSVPTLPRPLHLAAASLRDGGADLLAVAGSGTVVEIVATWEEDTRVFAAYDLSTPAGAGAEILSMAAVSAPGTPAGAPLVAPAVPGRAWLVVGFSGGSDGQGGKLVVLDFGRGPDGSVAIVGQNVERLGFDPVSLAVSPDGFHLYAATPDPITDFTVFPPLPGARQVLGAAEVDMGGGIGAAWPVRGLDARAPTTLVAAAILGERQVSAPDTFEAPVARVYAALDPSGCGTEKPIGCGIAMLDPALGGLASDPAPAGTSVPPQTYRTPLSVPGTPLTLAVAMPSVAGPLQCLDDCPPKEVPTQPVKQPLMKFAPEGGARWTTGTGVVGTADGHAWMLDLGNYAAGNTIAILPKPVEGQPLPGTRLNAAVQSRTPRLPDGSQATAGLALYLQYPGSGETAGLTSDSQLMSEAVMVWPGFTPYDIWYLTWQGRLPGLGGQSATLGLDASGRLWLAFQSPLLTEWLQVGDPQLGIHAADQWLDADLAQFQPDLAQFPGGQNPCAVASPSGSTVEHEAPVASILAPWPTQYPGGALLLSVPTDPASDPYNLICLAAYLASPPPGSPAVLAGKGSVRASGLVLAGSVTGYAGRPPMLTKADVDGGTVSSKRFDFAWAEESTLTGEALVLARKARRLHYPPASCDEGRCDAYPELKALYKPLAAGPVLGFVVGPQCSDEPPGSNLKAICPPQRLGELQRDSYLVITTQGGLSPASRRPTPISLPSSAVPFDKSQLPGGEPLGSVFYIAYQLDSVLMMVPGQPFTSSTTLR